MLDACSDLYGLGEKSNLLKMTGKLAGLGIGRGIQLRGAGVGARGKTSRAAARSFE